MDWMTMEWITTYWMPLAVAIVIGFVLGWLLTGLSPRRKNAAYEAQIADMQGKSRRTERDLADAQKQISSLKNDVSRATSESDGLRTQLSAIQEELKGVHEQKEVADADLQARNIEVADAKMQLAMLQDQLDRAQSSAANELEELRARYESAVVENTQLREAYDTAQANISSIEADASATADLAHVREIALNEAYQRAASLQRLLEDSERVLIDTQAELQSAKANAEVLTAANAELDDRLQKARGNVASEMAALTSTMIKMKDDALVAANSRIAELTKQVNELQSKQAVG